MPSESIGRRVLVVVEVSAHSEHEAFTAVDDALKVSLGSALPFVRSGLYLDDVAYPILRRKGSDE